MNEARYPTIYGTIIYTHKDKTKIHDPRIVHTATNSSTSNAKKCSQLARELKGMGLEISDLQLYNSVLPILLYHGAVLSRSLPRYGAYMFSVPQSEISILRAWLTAIGFEIGVNFFHSASRLLIINPHLYARAPVYERDMYDSLEYTEGVCPVPGPVEPIDEHTEADTKSNDSKEASELPHQKQPMFSLEFFDILGEHSSALKSTWDEGVNVPQVKKVVPNAQELLMNKFLNYKWDNLESDYLSDFINSGVVQLIENRAYAFVDRYTNNILDKIKEPDNQQDSLIGPIAALYELKASALYGLGKYKDALMFFYDADRLLEHYYAYDYDQLHDRVRLAIVDTEMLVVEHLLRDKKYGNYKIMEHNTDGDKIQEASTKKIKEPADQNPEDIISIKGVALELMNKGYHKQAKEFLEEQLNDELRDTEIFKYLQLRHEIMHPGGAEIYRNQDKLRNEIDQAYIEEKQGKPFKRFNDKKWIETVGELHDILLLKKYYLAKNKLSHYIKKQFQDKLRLWEIISIFPVDGAISKILEKFEFDGLRSYREIYAIIAYNMDKEYKISIDEIVNRLDDYQQAHRILVAYQDVHIYAMKMTKEQRESIKKLKVNAKPHGEKEEDKEEKEEKKEKEKEKEK